MAVLALGGVLSLGLPVAHAQQPFNWEALIGDSVEAGLSVDTYFTGEQLYREANRAFVSGYVTAVLDTGSLAPKTRRYCAPAGVTNGQAVDVVMKYLEATPENRHLGAAHLVRQAMRRVWPCPPEVPAPAAPPARSRPQS